MHFVSGADVSRILTFPLLIATMEEAHRRPKAEVLDGFLGDEKAQYVIRSAVERGRYMASKMFTSFPANLAAGEMPAVQAVCVLFDGSNGRSSTALRSRIGGQPPIPRLARSFSRLKIPKSCSSLARVRWRNGLCVRTARCGRRFGASSSGTGQWGGPPLSRRDCGKRESRRR
jgi:hypothetical protein